MQNFHYKVDYSQIFSSQQMKSVSFHSILDQYNYYLIFLLEKLPVSYGNQNLFGKNHLLCCRFFWQYILSGSIGQFPYPFCSHHKQKRNFHNTSRRGPIIYFIVGISTYLLNFSYQWNISLKELLH